MGKLRDGEFGFITLRVDDSNTMIVFDDSGPAEAKWKDFVNYCRDHEQECFFGIVARGGKSAFISWVPEDCPYAEDRELYSRNGEGLKEAISSDTGLNIVKYITADDLVDLDEEPKLT